MSVSTKQIFGAEGCVRPLLALLGPLAMLDLLVRLLRLHRVQGAGVRVEGAGLRVQVQGLGFSQNVEASE